MIESIILYLVLGAVAGVAAGLFGIGGGLVIVPALIFSFTSQGLPEAVVTHSAIATSLATIVLTSIYSIKAHQSRGGVNWALLRPLAVGIAVGASLGVLLADSLSGQFLQILLGIFATCMALYLGLGFEPKSQSKTTGKPELVAAGSFIGAASSLFGIGGGTLTVPYLSYRGVEMRQAVGTSAACGFPIAFVAAIAYGIAGMDAQGMPDYSFGYIYLPAFFCVGLASSQFAKLGAKWAHALPQRRLKQIFALFLFVVGVRFLITNLTMG
ncbi:MAG TPA: sulfite exporter TauE/SafE family protein [Marinobacterium sp.]|nr:sulfite exporter TauE/SafE family protein [Marinobacterium sp.]